MRNLLILALAVFCGCSPLEGARRPNPGKPVEIPIANLPRPLREWNWGGGSCVHASTVMHFRWHNCLELADYWRKTYSGGESYNGLTGKLQKNKIPYYATINAGRIGSANDFIRFCQSHGGCYGTTSGDADVLERCSAERRGGVIFYYPNHSIWFCGFATVGGKDVAVVLDNNRIEAFIAIEKQQFIKNWRGYGGVCVVPTAGNPRAPIPYIAKR